MTNPMLDPEERARLRRLCEEATPGEWRLCYHLSDPEHDAKCGCGYRGGVWSGDGESLLLEMGRGSEQGADMIPTPDRATTLANARFIAAARPALPLLLDALEAVERERDEAQGRWLERWGQLCGTVSQIQAERDRLREEVADLGASFCAASFRVESEQRARLNRCIAVVSECDNSVPVFEIIERLSALAARTPEGGTDALNPPPASPRTASVPPETP